MMACCLMATGTLRLYMEDSWRCWSLGSGVWHDYSLGLSWATWEWSNLAVTDFKNFICYQPCPGSRAQLNILIAERGTGTISKWQLHCKYAESCTPVARLEKEPTVDRESKNLQLQTCAHQHPGQEWQQSPTESSRKFRKCNSSSLELESKTLDTYTTCYLSQGFSCDP